MCRKWRLKEGALGSRVYTQQAHGIDGLKLFLSFIALFELALSYAKL
jgi:hypothetical protein